MFGLIVICLLFSSTLSFECTGNGYFRDPEDCAKMVRCSNGKITHRFSCGEGKVFNDITKACEHPKYVNCQSSMPATPEVTSSSSVTITESISDLTELPISTPISSLTQSSSPISSTSSSLINTTSTTPPQTNNVSIDSISTPVLIEESLITETTPAFLNESFVVYEEEEEQDSSITTVMTTELPLTETIVTTESSTTSSPVTPTSFANNVSPVLESILQNDTTAIETMVTESTLTPETTTKSDYFCAIEETQNGLKMISSNYSTNETSKLSDFYKIVCYFTNWSRYRSDSGKFTFNNINPFLCTHIIYSFAILDNETLTIKPSDECTDIDNGYYERVTGLKKKNPKLKVLIALGGWVDSEGDKYSRLVSNRTKRNNFIDNAIEFIIKHNFDGLDLDWEFPKCWQANCSAGPHSDQINFSKLIREFKIAFNKQSIPLLLTAAVSANKQIIDNAYDINSLMFNLDFINLMAYDYYTTGEPFAAHHSPLYSHPNSKNPNHIFLNANYSTNYWISKGMASHKIILGIPFYGRTFKLVNTDINDIGAPVNGTGNEGLFTREKGFISYYEICTNLVNKGWAKRVDSHLYNGLTVMTGPYAYDNDQWVGYDDRDHVIQKTKYIKELNLGGAMIWAIDLDDFNGICCRIKSPLLKTINHELRGYKFDLNFFCP